MEALPDLTQNSTLNSPDSEESLRNFDAERMIKDCKDQLDKLPKAKTYDEIMQNVEKFRELFSQNEEVLIIINDFKLFIQRNPYESRLLDLNQDFVKILKLYIKDCQQNFKGLKNISEKWKTNFMKLQNKFNELDLKNSELGDKLKKSENELSSTVSANKIMIQKIKENNSQITWLSDNLKEADKTISNRDIEINYMKEQIFDMQKQFKKSDARFKEMEERFEAMDKRFKEIENSLNVVKFKTATREVVKHVRNNVCKELSVFLEANITDPDQIVEEMRLRGETEQSIREIISNCVQNYYNINYNTYKRIMKSGKSLSNFICECLEIKNEDISSLEAKLDDEEQLEALIALFNPIQSIANNIATVKKERKKGNLCYKCNRWGDHECLKCSLCKDRGHDSQACPRKIRCDLRREERSKNLIS